MKRLYFIINLLLLISFMATAQLPGNRTTNTKVADALAQLPAQTQTEYNTIIADLVSTGEEGILLMAKRMNPPGKGSNASIEYALSGVSRYVSNRQFEKERKETALAYCKALDLVSAEGVKTFIISQLGLIGKEESIATLEKYQNDNALSDPVKRALESIRSIRIEQEPLLKSQTKNAPSQERCAALNALLKNNIKERQKNILSALNDKDRAYRNVALSYISSVKSPTLVQEIIKKLKKAKPDTQVDIINWLGNEKQKTALPVLHGYLINQNREVVSATVRALLRIGDTSSVTYLAALLKDADKEKIQWGKESLASFNGNIGKDIAAIIPEATDEGKIAALDLLAKRKADAYSAIVFELVEKSNPAVQQKAFTTLKDVVMEKDLSRLYIMLENSFPEEVEALQNAVISALSQQPKEKQYTIINSRMQAAGNNKYLYYVILANTGRETALKTLVDGFNNENIAEKDAAFQALTKWKGTEVLEELSAICQNPSASAYFDRALNTYVSIVVSSTYTPENKLISLRNAMEIAKTNEQKNIILSQIGKTNTFQALMYAGKFLDIPALQQTAAMAVMNIGVAYSEYSGNLVKDILKKAANVLNGPDAEYQQKAILKHLSEMPDEKGFVSLFNGEDLTGWKGLVKNPVERAKMKPAELQKEQVKANESARQSWIVENGNLLFTGRGDNLCTDKQYGDFEMYIDWKLYPGPEPDAGIYLRGTPQVQIWDISRTDVGAEVGSGGLYNNNQNPSKPIKVADNKLGEWNSFYIKMIGERVTVYLNGELIVDNVILENYWNRKSPIFPIEQIELQAHGSKVAYRDIYLREIESVKPFILSDEEKKDGFRILFDGTSMNNWTGNTIDYITENGCITLYPGRHGGGNLYTKEEFSDFIYRFEFQLTPAANNGLGIRTPMEGDAAYVGMELQILDNEASVYKDLAVYQYHGSVYGIIPAKRGYLKPVGDWNYQEVIAKGDQIKITLNGEIILVGNIREATKNGTPDQKEHPGLFNPKGHIGFLGHGSEVRFRNIRIKELK